MTTGVLTTFASSDLPAIIRATWDLTPDLNIHIETVHRVDQSWSGRHPYGIWDLARRLRSRVADDRPFHGRRRPRHRVELFDEADLDTALARFEELQPQARRLENAASQVVERFWAYFEARDWDAMAEVIADDCCTHDRRRVFYADVLRSRAAHVTNMRAVAEVGFDGLTSSVVATREHRLALIRIRFLGAWLGTR